MGLFFFDTDGAVQGGGQFGEDVDTDVILSVLDPGDMTLPDGTAFGQFLLRIAPALTQGAYPFADKLSYIVIHDGG